MPKEKSLSSHVLGTILRMPWYSGEVKFYVFRPCSSHGILVANHGYSRVVFSIALARETSYYIYRIVLSENVQELSRCLLFPDLAFSRRVFNILKCTDMVLLFLMGAALTSLRANEPDRESSPTSMALRLATRPSRPCAGIAGTIGVFSCMVAWEFILISSVPQIPYQTRLDLLHSSRCDCLCTLCV